MHTPGKRLFPGSIDPPVNPVSSPAGELRHALLTSDRGQTMVTGREHRGRDILHKRGSACVGVGCHHDLAHLRVKGWCVLSSVVGSHVMPASIREDMRGQVKVRGIQLGLRA